MKQTMAITLGLAIAGQVFYQIGQRSVPRDAHPLVVLAIAYFVAGILCVALALPFGASFSGEKMKVAFSWPTAMVALSILAIEVGFLTAYRSGWTVGTGYAVASTATMLGLALIGKFVFDNPVSARQLAGLVLSSVAVWLLTSGTRPS
jgi:multidrug transporter EmrE-like cation transporter